MTILNQESPLQNQGRLANSNVRKRVALLWACDSGEGHNVKTGVYIVFKHSNRIREGGFDVMTAESKRGRVEKRLQHFRFIITHQVSDAELHAISSFVGELNEA